MHRTESQNHTVDANEQHYQLSIIGENCDQKNRMTKGNPLNRKHSYATLCMLAVSFSHFTNEKFPIYFHCNFSMTFFFSQCRTGRFQKGERTLGLGESTIAMAFLLCKLHVCKILK